MPSRPKKLCSYPGCNERTSGARCAQHVGDTHDRYRASANERGYNYAWSKYRARFLKLNPLCVRCKEEGRLTAATVVDHITPHKGNKQLFKDKSNHQPLCETCHNRKTATEDMGAWK